MAPEHGVDVEESCAVWLAGRNFKAAVTAQLLSLIPNKLWFICQLGPVCVGWGERCTLVGY